MVNIKICIVGSEKPYPAFNSVLFILKEILGLACVKELRIKELTEIKSSILKPFVYFMQDIKLLIKILRLRKEDKKIYAIMFFQGYYPLTSIGLRVSSLRLLLYVGGSAFKSGYYQGGSFMNRIFAYSNILIQEICHKLSNLIIVPSKSTMDWLGVQKYANKVRFAIAIINTRFFSDFKVQKSYVNRKEVIGYVGSFSKSKGILNLLESIQLIVNRLKDKAPKFILIGDGPLLKNSPKKRRKYSLSKNVILTGYVPYADLPKHYNKMKLLVLPSYTEGLPSVVLEAMACGTPVLATPVGAIPDIIKNGETGFLLESNDPKHITDKIIELLSKPELLEKVSKNAYEHVRRNFSFKETLEAWRKIFEQLQ